MKTPQVKPDWNYGIWNGRSVMVQDTHDPNYGDNTICDLCKDVFDARNSDYEVINNKWICGRCLELRDIHDEIMIHDGLPEHLIE